MSTRPTARSRSALVLSLLFLVVPAAAFAGGDANILFGSEPLDQDEWGPVKDQFAAGAEVTFGRSTWPVWIAIDYFDSSKVEKHASIFVNGQPFTEELTGQTFELDLGIRKIWGKGKPRPFLGGGVGLIGASLDADIVSDDDYTAGLWAGGGIFWRLGRRFNIGGTVRWSDAEVTLFGEDVQAGGFTYGLLLGWGWPAGS